MEKTYQPESIERHWRETWEKQGYFQPSGKGAPFAIALPPPNVTGTLHMGHGFQQTLMDLMTRHARMSGHNTLWQPGTDHAGIATQMVVERELAKENQTRHELGREAFIEKIWAWREQSGGTITEQMRRLGTSIDWTRERFSMDEDITRATYTAFIKLFDQGLIYRGKRLVNWDPKLHTAISDLEVEHTEEKGALWSIRYPLSDGSGHLIVATTRPETLFGDSAVAVNPKDSRYAALIGKTLTLPLCDREIPIIADDYVEPEFGTGCVKITPAHDFNDYAVGQRHNLPQHTIFTMDARLNDTVPAPYRGLDRFEARQRVLKDLTEAGLLEKEAEYTVKTPRGDRSGVIIEPMLTDQWYVAAKKLAPAAIDAVKTKKLQFLPQHWEKTYLQWLESIEDWCISRQLWWGHRIPIWYDKAGTPYAGLDEQDARARHSLNNSITLTQDEDVLDTWFTASLWPFSSLGWPEQTNALKQFYPNSVMVTGFDIIFFWVARMVMMGLHFMKDVPFKTVYITGLIRDSQGRKMSKSKGNVLDPIDLIDGISLENLVEKRCFGLMQPEMAKKVEKATRKEFSDGINAHGTDALRMTFCSMATTSQDIQFDGVRLESYRNFCNKLWNAARFIFMQTDDQPINEDQHALSIADRWIASQLQSTIKTVTQAFAEFRFDLAMQRLYEFTWDVFCDWYLELSKSRLQNPNVSDADKAATRHQLLQILETLLRLLHPIAPFITESIWQEVAKRLSIEGESIMLQPYPLVDAQKIDSNIETQMEWFKTFVSTIRNLRSELQVSPAKAIELVLENGNNSDRKLMGLFSVEIAALVKVANTTWLTTGETLPVCTSAPLGDLTIHIPLAGLIDKAEELKRATKAIQKLEKEASQLDARLSSTTFVAKAPEAVVNKAKQQLAELYDALNKLRLHQERIESL